MAEKKRLQVTAALIFSEGRVLVTSRRSGTQWEFPGGKLEPGETLEECVVREIQEELRLEISVIRPFLSVDYEDNESFLTLHTFICRIKSGWPSCPQGESYAWARLEDLPQYNLLPADKRVVHVLFSAKYSDIKIAEERK